MTGAHLQHIQQLPSFMSVAWFIVKSCVIMFVWQLTSVRVWCWVIILEANSNYFCPFIGQCITQTAGLLAPVSRQQLVHGLYRLAVFSVNHTQNNCVYILMECISSAVEHDWYLKLKTNKDFRTKAKPKQTPRLASGQAMLKGLTQHKIEDSDSWLLIHTMLAYICEFIRSFLIFMWFIDDL